jgi:hypothetical protein
MDDINLDRSSSTRYLLRSFFLIRDNPASQMEQKVAKTPYEIADDIIKESKQKCYTTFRKYRGSK